MTDNRPSDSSANADRNAGIVTRRRALMMGAITASAVVSIKPALAQTAGSVLNCEIPVPDNSSMGGHIAADGTVVSPDTPGAFPPAGRNFTGEEVRQAMNGRTLPGTSYDQSQAYVNYIRRLQAGQSGFTCYASLQMPR
tara:strand:- start:937 stop:1353 length:417 start_codon:yes stop_codon:yes gene_type:complete